ncbi:5,10-methenyltetrahydrofolate synthetase [Mizugakiibacter sediminis]|uniref:5-formyltetrahydrofolate cyclo-ligase n=1 Tax=Mizugakiibacter sediminis TaxID=1475481 RepID=A0A0K8QMS1_9GAMM|nr:5,10-methenyltetrahydrofolate synthetase [Mizugakiibacter sediminis]
MRTGTAEGTPSFLPPRTRVDADRRDQRARLSERRQALPAAARIEAAQGVARQLERLPEFLVDARIGGYWAVTGELPLNVAVGRLAARGQYYHLPVIAGARRLMFAPYRSGDALQANRYGIPEPAVPPERWLAPQDMDLVLVPLLAFDRRGHRLGFGGGYYDASFAFLREQARPARPLLVGVAYAFQEISALRAQPWDVRLDYVATEHELIDCTEQDEAR